jgi:hypothetical protein
MENEEEISKNFNIYEDTHLECNNIEFKEKECCCVTCIIL